MDRYDPDELLVCPYDPVHRVARKRFQGHLVKCRKNYNTKHFASCPFNAKHVVHKPELSYHISICEDRGRLEQEIHHSSSIYKAKGNTSIPVHNWRPPSPNESWDDDNVKYVPKEMSELQNEEEKPETMTNPTTVEKPKPVLHTNPVVRIPNRATDSQSLVYKYSLERGSGGRGRGRGISSQDPVTVPLAIGRSKGILGMSQPPGFNVTPGGPNNGPSNLSGGAGGVGPPGFNVTPHNGPSSYLSSGGAGGVGMVTSMDLPQHHQSQHASDTKTIQDTSKSNSQDQELMLKKRVRKLNKMMKQIEQLEIKQVQGSELDSDQLAKLARKQTVQDNLIKAQEDLSKAEAMASQV